MPVGYLTSSTFIATVKREAMIPTHQSTFTEADFLAMANQEIRVGLVPSIMQYHEEYFSRDSELVPLVAGQTRYAIPYRAVGGKFREIFLADGVNSLRSMTRISPDDRNIYQGSGYFYLEGNEVVLSDNAGVGSIMFTYYMRPNELVNERRVSTITAIVVDPILLTTTYTVDAIPANVVPFVQDGVRISSFSTLSKLDILQTRPGHKTIVFDVLPTLVDTVALTITFNTVNVSSAIVVGDYIAFAGECIIPQVPADLQDVLCQRVVLRCLQALGDKDGFGMAGLKLIEMEKWSATLVDNRAEGTPSKAVNSRGLLRSFKYR